MNRFRIDRVVGLSTEAEPQSLSRTECPSIRNVEVDLGGICRTRNGYKRLHATTLKDASWRLRGAPYNVSIYNNFYDALVIPNRSAYTPTASNEFYMGIAVEIRENAIGFALSGLDEVPIVAKGTPADLKIHLRLVQSGGFWFWRLSVKEATTPATLTVNVADTALDGGNQIGTKRFVEFGSVDGTGSLNLKVYNLDTGASIGTASDAAFQSKTFDAGTAPILIGAYPGTDGYPSITAGFQYAPIRVAEVRIATDFVAATPAIAVAGTSGIQARELLPSEYSGAEVKGYWKCNDGDYLRLRDSCDLTEDEDYRGTLEGNHGGYWNIGPQWIGKENSIRLHTSTNPDVSDGVGVGVMGRFGLFFNGLTGVALARTGTLDANNILTDPLSTVFIQTPAAGVGWAAELIWTPLLDVGETAYPDRTLYCSTNNGTVVGGINPLVIKTVSDRFVAVFDDGTGANKTITLTGQNVSTFAGEMVTLTATRDNNTFSFFAVGEHKFDSGAIATGAGNVPTIAGGVNAGPFVMLGRLVNAFVGTTNTDDPATYSTLAARGVFHAFRLWSIPRNLIEAIASANKDVPIAGRNTLPVYLTADAGYGRQLTNFGTIENRVLQTASTGSPPAAVTVYMDSKIVPPAESGPVPDVGLVEPFRPVKVQGAVDFRNNIDEATSRKIAFIGGCAFYTFDLKDNTLTAESGGVFKRSQQFSMVPYAGRIYFTNGGRPKVFDAGRVREDGIEAPLQRPYVSTSSAGGTLDDGVYFVGYRFANTESGFVSNLSPLRMFTLSGGNTSQINSISGIETPNDPQVNAVEIFLTLEGAPTVLYWYDITTSITSGTYSIAAGIDALLVANVDITRSISLPNLAAATPTLGDLFLRSPPPPSRAIGVMGSRMLFAATLEPGQVYFSRVQDGPEVEHVNTTPGSASRISVETDQGDEIKALAPFDGDLVAYLRDARVLISFNNLDLSGSPIDIPFQVQFLDVSRGAVSPNAVVNLLTEHAFFSESDIFIRSTRDDRNISSASAPENLPARPRIGRTIRNLKHLDNVVAMHYQDRQQIWFACTGSGTTRNDRILVYSYRQPNRWTQYIMPWVDFILIAEGLDDRELPIGFVNGFVCQLDLTDVENDAYDAAVTAVFSTNQTSYNSTTQTMVISPASDSFSVKFRPLWIRSAGADYIVVALHGPAMATSIIIDPLGQTLPDGAATVLIGAINPMIQFICDPSGVLDPKRYRVLNLAMGEGGSDSLEVQVWFDKFGYDPLVSSASIAGQTVTIASNANQFARTDCGGTGRFALIQVQSPAGVMSLSSVSIEHDVMPAVRTYG